MRKPTPTTTIAPITESQLEQIERMVTAHAKAAQELELAESRKFRLEFKLWPLLEGLTAAEPKTTEDWAMRAHAMRFFAVARATHFNSKAGQSDALERLLQDAGLRKGSRVHDGGGSEAARRAFISGGSNGAAGTAVALVDAQSEGSA